METYVQKEDILYEGKEIKGLQREREKLYAPSTDYYTGEVAQTARIIHRR